MLYEYKLIDYFTRKLIQGKTKHYKEALDILYNASLSQSGNIIEIDNDGNFTEVAYKKAGSNKIACWK